MRWRPSGTKSDYDGGAIGESGSDVSNYNSRLETSSTEGSSQSNAEATKKRKRGDIETRDNVSKRVKSDQVSSPGEDDSVTKVDSASPYGLTKDFMDIDAKVVSPSPSPTAEKPRDNDRDDAEKDHRGKLEKKKREKHKDRDKSHEKDHRKKKDKTEKKEREKHKEKSGSKEKSSKKHKEKREIHGDQDK
jgi:hypothetical protein